MADILLSGLLMVHNEEKVLASCLERLGFCDEIVVVLDKCTDNSEAIAKKYGARTYKGSWEIEGKRRNFGRDKCRGKWIFDLDADMHIPKALADEILCEIKKHDDGYFGVSLVNIIGDTEIKHGWSGTWGVTGGAYLAAKDSKRFTEKDRLHPPVVLTGKNHGTLRTPFLHYAAEDLSELVRRFDTYTTLRAMDMRDDPAKLPSLWRDSRRIVSRFFDSYIRLKGYREGGFGFMNAVFAALYHITAHLKATMKDGMKSY